MKRDYQMKSSYEEKEKYFTVGNHKEIKRKFEITKILK
jgi:hypothetical protein